jgi:transposase-like protein
MLRRGNELGEGTNKHDTKDFKSKVAIAAFKGEKQLSELAAEFKFHQSLISSWERQLMEQVAGVLETKCQKVEQDSASVSEELAKTVGHQTIRIDWPKKLGISESWRGGH